MPLSPSPTVASHRLPPPTTSLLLFRPLHGPVLDLAQFSQNHGKHDAAALTSFHLDQLPTKAAAGMIPLPLNSSSSDFRLVCRQLTNCLSRFGLVLPGRPTNAIIQECQIRFADSRSILEAPHSALLSHFLFGDGNLPTPEIVSMSKLVERGPHHQLQREKEPLGPRPAVALHHEITARKWLFQRRGRLESRRIHGPARAVTIQGTAFSSGSASRLLLSQIFPFGTIYEISWNYRCPLETNEGCSSRLL
ncbi:hypothetical protein CI238_03050 [Colletotrichum incanum]|uniref:Uncharacterized protein n=1 Tax=Colletotrichum incanum TaxID=1573173 RepID=A0A161YAJ0_COLIC|nr:hypothetical protein CI238_03050 [Colletotrichum incanum]